MLNRSATDRRHSGFPGLRIVINTCFCLNSSVWVYHEKNLLLMNRASWKPVQLDEPFRDELNNPSAYTSLKIAHFLEFPESSSKTPFFHVPWSEWSWITNPNPDPPDGTHPKTSFLSCTVISVILDHKSKSGSSQRNAPQYSDSPYLSEASGTWRI